MKIAAIRSHRLYKPIMLGSALLILIIALMISYYMNRERNKTITSSAANTAEIRKATALKLNKDPDELSDKDFALITELSVGQMSRATELYDIKLLEKFVNLQELNLNYLKFPAGTIPKGMSYLEKTGIYDPSERNVFDLSPLKKLSELRKLDISKTPLKDFKPLVGLTKLESLNLTNTQISDIESLSGLANLQILGLNRTPAFDLEPLRGLTNLHELSLISIDISSLEPIKGLTNLQKLVIERTKVSDLEPLRELTNLRELVIERTKVSDIEPLKGLVNLQTLDIKFAPVTNIEPLKGLTNLRVLSFLGQTNISDLEPISGLTDLQKIVIADAQISDIEPLRKLVNLQELNISSNPVANLWPIKGLKNTYTVYKFVSPLYKRINKLTRAICWQYSSDKS